MDYFKKARSQVKGAVKEAQGMAQQLQGQYKQQQGQSVYASGQQQPPGYQNGGAYQQQPGYPQHPVGQHQSPEVQYGAGIPSQQNYPQQYSYPQQIPGQPQFHGIPYGGGSPQPQGYPQPLAGQHFSPGVQYGGGTSYPQDPSYHQSPPPANNGSHQPGQHQPGLVQPRPQEPQSFNMSSMYQALPNGQQLGTPTAPAQQQSPIGDIGGISPGVPTLQNSTLPPNSDQRSPASPVQQLPPPPAIAQQYSPADSSSQAGISPQPYSSPQNGHQNPSVPPNPPTVATGAPHQPHPNAQHGSSPPSTTLVAQNQVAPPLSASSLTPCPLFEEALVDRVSFYIFQNHLLTQGNEKLDADQFGICSTCFVSSIAPYPHLASAFKLREKTPTHPDAPKATFEKLLCQFALPTVRQTFYQCVHQNSIDPLIRLARLNSTLPECTGAIFDQPVDYYGVKGTELAICKTCFGRYLRNTAFEREVFLHAPDTNWGCDVGPKGFIQKSLVTELADRQPRFSRFANTVKQRLTMRCPGQNEPLWPEDSPGPVYTWEGTNGKAGVFCQACYFDTIHGTSMDPFFNNFVKLEEQYRNLSCDLAGIVSKFAMEVAIRAGDDEVWRRCVGRRGDLPLCAGANGVDEGALSTDSPWYCSKEHPSVEICPFCWNSTVELLGAGHLFTPITRPLQAGVIRMCYLAVPKDINADMSDSRNFENTLVWRGIMIRRWIHQGYDWHGNFHGLQHVIKAIASWPPPCAGGSARQFTPLNGRKWFGNKFLANGDDNRVSIVVCEECYDHYIKDTPLQDFAGHDLTEQIYRDFPKGFGCNTMSRRACDELSDACEKGDWMQFVAYWVARRDVEARLKAINVRCQEQADRQAVDLAVLNMQNSMAATQLMGQLTANTNATIMRVGGSVAEAASPDYGQRFGNSTVGYGYLTSAGANSAQADHDAANLSRKGLSVQDFRPTGSTWQDTQQLLKIASEITAEWDAIK